MENLTNKDKSINPHEYFTIPKGKNAGKKLKVVATENTHKGNIWNDSVEKSVDTIKNLETGKTTKVTREELIKLNGVI